jgi:hypothetical protein
VTIRLYAFRSRGSEGNSQREGRRELFECKLFMICRRFSLHSA